MEFFNFSKNKNKAKNNFFFLGTIFVIIVNCLFYFVVDEFPVFGNKNNWDSVLDFSNLFAHFFSAFTHFNAQHVLLNSLCFFIAGGYVERKRGTLGLLVLVFIFAFFGECVTAANNHAGNGGYGFSGVNYCFYAYIIVDFIFSFKEIKSIKSEMIVSIVVLCLIYIACCFCGGTAKFAFKIYPYDLINNLGHYSGFLTGLVLSLILKLCRVNK